MTIGAGIALAVGCFAGYTLLGALVSAGMAWLFLKAIDRRPRI